MIWTERTPRSPSTRRLALAVALALGVAAGGCRTGLLEDADSLDGGAHGCITEADRARVRADLQRIYEASVAYYVTPHTTLSGAQIPMFPVSIAVTPAAACCEQPENICAPDEAAFDRPTWISLGFTPSAPERHRFGYDSAGVREYANFTAWAIGDEDCCGRREMIYVSGVVADGGIRETGPAAAPDAWY
jgi:hypothetical protein